MMENVRLGAILAAVWFLGACSAPKPEPAIASSSNHAIYAQTFPEELQAEVKDFSEREQEAKTVMGEMGQYPGALKEPAWNHVLAAYERADEAGRSHAYVERAREVRGVLTFFEEEKGDISKKVGGNVQYAASQKGCNLDAYGAVSRSLEDAVVKQAEERLRERNEAHVIINRHRESLGKENVAALEQQTDKIAYASYVTHIYLVELKLRLRRQLEEAENVRKTADQFIEEEVAYQREPKRTDAEKKQSQERVEAMNKSKASLDSAISQTKSVAEKMEERLAALQKDYGSAVESLKEKVRSRAGAK